MAGFTTVAPLLVILALIVAWTVRTDRQSKLRMKHLADALGAVSSGTGGTGDLQGMAYRFAYSAGTRNSPPSLRVTIDSALGQPFQVVREGRTQRVSKEIGLSAEIQTGDPSFDQKFYIETDAVEFTRALLMRDEARAAVRTLFGIGFTTVCQSMGRLQAVWSPFKLHADVDPSVVSGAVAQLATLVHSMPTVPVTAQPARLGVGKTIPAGTAAMIVLVLGLSFGAAPFRPLDSGAVLRDSLRYSIPALLMWLAFAFVQLKGRSTAYKELGLVALLSVVCLVPGGSATEILVNGLADAGPSSTHDTQVVRTYSSGGRRTTYHVLVKSWRYQRRTEDFTVPSSVYRHAHPHERIEVVTKPGRLGFEWLVSYALRAP